MMKRLTTIMAVLAVVAGAAGAAYVVYTGAISGASEGGPAGAAFSGSIPAEPAAVQAGSFPTMSEPKRIAIPSLGIDAPVEPVGITEKGNMAVPKSYSRTGWYRHGAKPGDAGTAVLAGHVDNGFGLDGVFKDLKNAKPGDIIAVVDDTGATSTFRVTGTKYYDYDAKDTAEVFASEDGKARLNLVTCDGAWIKEKKTYDRRLVVFSERVS